MDLLVRVQHVPKRADLLGRLLPRLEPLRVEVIADPEPDAPRASAWRTYHECLRREWDGSHLLIVQDDAVPADGFATAAVNAIRARPDAIVAMFLSHVPGKTVRLAHAANHRGERWSPIHPRDFIPVVATCYPRAIVDDLLAWCARSIRSPQVGDDGIVGRFHKQMCPPAYVTIPSLVQHPDDVPSSFRHRSPRQVPRTASIWQEGDISDITWDPYVPSSL